MNDLIAVEKIAQWQKLKTLVLDSVSSPITKRVYNMALDEFMGWFQQELRPGAFTKATVSAWRVSLEARGLGSSSIIIRMSAIRKLAAEAADNGLLAPELAAGISRVKSAKTQKHSAACRTILVEKTDRLYRNITDWATLDELGVSIHFVKENVVIGPESRSNDQFVHGIKVLMARNYSLNLGEETTKGMLEKARAGLYPSNAPVGYRNTDGPAGKRIILPDPDTASVITELFGRFAMGRHSIKALVAEMRAEGITLRGRRLCSSTAHQILRKRLYMGDFNWDGVAYRGTHEALVTRQCEEQVQALLDARAENKTRKVKHDFAYTGLVHCGHCGCLLVGELKKGRYVYYHCTGNRGKCPEPYTRQEMLTGEFANILRDLVIPQPVLDWLGDAVLESDRTEQATREQANKRLRAQYEQIQARVETMYRDRLDGRIDAEFFDSHAAAWRRQQETLLGKIRDIQREAPAPIDHAIDMLQLTSRAAELFLPQPPHEQRHLLGVVMEKAAWKDRTLQATLFEPLEILRHSNRESYTKENENPGSGQDLEVWLPKTYTDPNTQMENLNREVFSVVLTKPGASRTPDPLRPRRILAIRQNRLFSKASVSMRSSRPMEPS